MGSLPFFVQLAKRTGLTKRTVKDLLRHGWTYKEFDDAFPIFEHPAANLKKKE